jgi:PAS domain S-box-containing protein
MNEDLFPGDSEMARRMRELDWSRTPLGPVEFWPPELRSCVGTCLECAFPIALFWGPEFAILYNDEYRRLLGPEKHPAALGKPGFSVWTEVWDQVGPMLDQVVQHGIATHSRDLRLLIERGFLEEAYFSFSCSPIRVADGAVGGVFCPIVETTRTIIGERRLRTLRDLAGPCKDAQSEDSIYQSAAEILAANPHDVPFALFYRIDPSQSSAELAAVAGISFGTAVSPARVSLGPASSDPWSLAAVTRSGAVTRLDNLSAILADLPRHPWQNAPEQALVLPVRPGGRERPCAVLVAALSPVRALDDDYRMFVEEIASALADALAQHEARRRLERGMRYRSEQFDTLLNGIPLGVYLVDADFRIRQVNPAALPFFGEIPGGVVGHDFGEIMHRLWSKDHADELIRIFRHTLETGEPYQTGGHAERRLDRGVAEDYEWRLSRITLTDGRDGLVCYFRDVTKDKQAISAKAYLAAIVDSADDAIIAKDLNGVIQSCNAAAERLFGYSSAELVGRQVRLLIPPELQSEEDEILAKLRRGDRVDHFETIRVTKDGRRLELSLTISPVRDDSGVVVGASKIARDITAVRQAEAERTRLLRDRALLTDTLNRVGTLVASDLDRSKVVQAVTDAATELTTAEFGAFFYNLVNDAGESYSLYTISGVPKESFSTFPMPRNTEVFSPTFTGAAAVRSADITQDPRYGHNAPYAGMPPGHLPVRSYLAVPVKGTSGDVLGGLFFGHSTVGRFNEQHERLAIGIASWASVALENARLYASVQEASRIKDEFLASLSHELRTPLNAILGYARMLRAGIVAPDKKDKAIDTIERNASSLTQIVEDVLDISRIVSGKIRLNVQAVEFPDIVRGAVDAVMPAADAKGVRIETVLDPHAAPVSGDPERLQQILWNLLSNAVKFTNRAGRVQVRLERIHSHVEVAVSDTGIGIAPDFLPHVFERFRQADAGIARERGGLGLGLSIARQLTEMHGGTLDVSSGGVGQGATFRLKLPLMIVHPSRDTSTREHPRSLRSPRGMPLADLRGVHVLAVDDEPDALSLVREVLEAAGAQVSTAQSAEAALLILDREVPDVLVADLGMPQLDGFQLIERVRRHRVRQVRETPAAALTAYARSEDRMKALRAGFHIHLAKPIDPAELVTTVASLAKRFAPTSPDEPLEGPSS